MQRVKKWLGPSPIASFNFLIASLLFGITCQCQEDNRAEKPMLDFISGESIQMDLDTLKKWIEAMHPAPYSHCTEGDWKEAYAAGKTMYTGGGTKLAAAQVFSQLTNVLKDSHTCVSLKSLSDDMLEDYGRLPFEITTIQNRIFIEDFGIEPFSKGTEIINVNDQSARMILGMALQLAPV